MGLNWAIIAGIIGAGIGIFLPVIAYQIVIMKQRQRQREMVPHVTDHWSVRIGTSLSNGIIWGLAVFYEANIIILFFIFIFAIIAILFTLIDWRIHIVPNEIVIIAIALGIIYQLIGYGPKSLAFALLCMAALFILFVILGLIMGLDKIGAGDVKLVAAMGLILGYPNVLYGVLAMCITLLLFIFVGMLSGKLTHVSMFAFAPFMMFGMMVGLITGIM